MKNRYHYIMMINYLSYLKKIYGRLSDTGLSIGEPKILEFLYENNGCVQKSIAKGCQIEPASVTSIMVKMENENLIYREKLNGNKKSSYVFLTELGKEKAIIVRNALRGLDEELLSDFSDDERRILIMLMKKINRKLMGGFLNED